MSESEQIAPSPDELMDVIVQMAVESCRLLSTVPQLFSQLDAGVQPRFEGYFRFFIKKIEEGLNRAGLTIVDLSGHPFDAGMAATALNQEDFAPDDDLVVDQMLEPIIMGKSGLVKRGVVMLRRVDS